MDIVIYTCNITIECIDIAENERIRTQCRPVSENLCVKKCACPQIEIISKISRVDDSDKQTKLCL